MKTATVFYGHKATVFDRYYCYRDLVHRQTACAAIKHMALGVYGFGCEDALIHLLNHVWPNVFETSPHLVQAFMDAVDGLRVALGPIKILQYTLQVCNLGINSHSKSSLRDLLDFIELS